MNVLFLLTTVLDTRPAPTFLDFTCAHVIEITHGMARLVKVISKCPNMGQYCLCDINQQDCQSLVRVKLLHGVPFVCVCVSVLKNCN